MKTYEQFVTEINLITSISNRVKRGALNPIGQREVRSGAAGRERVPVYTGRTNQGEREDRKTYATTDKQTANTFTNPGSDLFFTPPARSSLCAFFLPCRILGGEGCQTCL